MLRKRLLDFALRLNRRQLHEGIQGATAGLKPVTCQENHLHRRYVSTNATVAGTNTSTSACSNKHSANPTEVHNGVKHMDELHGPSLMTNFNWMFLKGYMDKTHLMQIEHKKIYGPIWKSKYGPLVVVNVADADLIQQVMRQEGKYPVRTNMFHWRRHREDSNQAYGPLSEFGFKWQEIRSNLNPRLMKPKYVTSYTDRLNDVITDYLNKMDGMREPNGQGVMVNDMAEELYRFAFEAISSVLFEKRLGCLSSVIPEETQKFITSVGETFRLSQSVIIIPMFLWPYARPWKDFITHNNYLFEFAGNMVQSKIDEIQEKANSEQVLDSAYLTHLLLSDKMTPKGIIGSITEVLLGGVDTSSNTLAWCLYHLAKRPEIQERLYQEVIRVCPGDEIPTSDDVGRMLFLKAAIKETLRMYPVVPGNARVNVEKEIVVGGYSFPKDTLFHLCHYATSYDENIFPDPHTFHPERWLRGDNYKQHPVASIPFGFGVRACIGRRVAELEMYLFMSRLLKRFEVRPDPAGKTVTSICRTLLCPGQPIRLQFVDRRVK
ncbi:sterol 26-hydroxylase, mitochondrial [Solea solea]|uniref:sterol 26-hydroxylase, mitochondrial n=1 Tax=Solea solea TaxID=90069 RepID=UPI00272C08E9|nr:sterol 26-hydroxylase, mitochondrial [Solea solea]